MIRTKMILMVTAIFAGMYLIVVSQTQSPITQTPQTMPTAQEQQLDLERSATTQKQINRYFHKDVIPKLKDCWARVKGQGAVEIKYTYRRDAAGKWIADRLAISSSTLPAGQDAVALQCMQDSVRSTTFAVENTDSSQSKYVLYWSWPVPFPPGFPKMESQAIAAAPTGGDGRGGCDGKGAPARCWACGPRGCKRTCVGGEFCRMTGRSCVMAGETCVSGGPIGTPGSGVIIQ